MLIGSTPLKNDKTIVKGNLTIKGITHPVEFETSQKGTSFKATITVDLTLYSVRYGSGKFFSNLGDNMISDKFILEVELMAEEK